MYNLRLERLVARYERIREYMSRAERENYATHINRVVDAIESRDITLSQELLHEMQYALDIDEYEYFEKGRYEMKIIELAGGRIHFIEHGDEHAVNQQLAFVTVDTNGRTEKIEIVKEVIMIDGERC